jgi:sec-independent protein translocase protein TatA
MASPLLPLANFGSFFGVDGLVILVVGLLIFGRRLPEVGKNVGRTIVEFKKGLSGAYNDKSEEAAAPEEPEQPTSSQRRLQSAPRVSVNANLEERPRATAAARKSLPQTEEV